MKLIHTAGNMRFDGVFININQKSKIKNRSLCSFI